LIFSDAAYLAFASAFFPFEKVVDQLRHKLVGRKKARYRRRPIWWGFSEPGAFSRAFKRWTGYSPRTMRASKNEND